MSERNPNTEHFIQPISNFAEDKDSDIELEKNLSPEAEEAINKWEFMISSFRRSQFAEFLRQKDENSFKELWKKLEDFVYKASREMPDFLITEFKGAKYGFNNSQSVETIRNLSVTLWVLSDIFYEDNSWRLITVRRNIDPQIIYDKLGGKIPLRNIEKRLLSQEQLLLLYNEARMFTSIIKMENEDVIGYEEFLPDQLGLAEMKLKEILEAQDSPNVE